MVEYVYSLVIIAIEDLPSLTGFPEFLDMTVFQPAMLDHWRVVDDNPPNAVPIVDDRNG